MRCIYCHGRGLVAYDTDDMGEDEVETCRECDGTGRQEDR